MNRKGPGQNDQSSATAGLINTQEGELKDDNNLIKKAKRISIVFIIAIGILTAIIIIILLRNLFLTQKIYYLAIAKAMKSENYYALISLSKCLDFINIKTLVIFVGILLLFFGASYLYYLIRIINIAKDTTPKSNSLHSPSHGVAIIVMGIITINLSLLHSSKIEFVKGDNSDPVFATHGMLDSNHSVARPVDSLVESSKSEEKISHPVKRQ